MNQNTSSKFLISILGTLLCLVATTAAASGNGIEKFTTVFPMDFGNPVTYTAEEMVQNCGGEFEDARAWMTLLQRGGRSFVHIRVSNTVPDTFFTVWLWVNGGSPLTVASVTALANPDEIPALGAATPASALTADANTLGLLGDDGSGSPEAPNGFWTNHRGNGSIYLKLDFPIVKGAYQFQEFGGNLAPARVIGNAPFSIRIASHCVDQVGHGLVPGKHEMWFDWSF